MKRPAKKPVTIERWISYDSEGDPIMARINGKEYLPLHHRRQDCISGYDATPRKVTIGPRKRAKP